MNATTMSERAAPAPAPPLVLAAEAIGVSYGRVRALESVSFGIRRGGTALVLGLNGAGKSTLMRALAGAVPLRSGRVILAGRDVSLVPAHRRVRRGISLVPEGRGVLPGLTVRENLELGWHAGPRSRGGHAGPRSARGWHAGPRSARGGLDEAVGRMLDLFPALSGRLGQDCRTLSGGQMQMLAIARALLCRPAVLLLDEPSLGLAPIVVADVYAALAGLGGDGLATVIVEQKAVPMHVTPDTVLVLRNGRVVHESHGARPSEEELARLYLHEGDRT